MDDSVLLRRGNKIIMGGRGRKGLGREREWGGKKEGREGNCGKDVICKRRINKQTSKCAADFVVL